MLSFSHQISVFMPPMQLEYASTFSDTKELRTCVESAVSLNQSDAYILLYFITNFPFVALFNFV